MKSDFAQLSNTVTLMGLSRLPLQDNSPVGNPPDPAIFNICQVDAPPVTSSELQTATHADPILGKVLSYVRRR